MTPATGPAFLLVSAFLLGGCSLLPSKDKSIDANAVAAVSGPPSFDIEVEAPKEVRELLTKHMELQRFRSLPDLHRSELIRLLGTADANIRDLLGTLGYFSPSIELQLIETPESAETPRKVLVTVDPGPPTLVRSALVEFSGRNADDPEGLRRREAVRREWSLKPGEQFSQSGWSGAKSQGLKRLQERRYPMAKIADSRADIDADTQQADLKVHYEAGTAYYFGPLQIQGAARYDPDGARRIARLPVGEEYRLTSLLDAQQRLANSGYYESVFLTLDQSPQDAGDAVSHAPVIAQVREAKLQKWVYGIGLSTDTGPRLSVDHTHNKLPWLGWRTVTKLQLDRKNPLLSTRLTDLPDDHGWQWFTGLKAERQDLADYRANTLELRAGRLKTEDRIDRNYYLQYDFSKQQGLGAAPSSSSISANYGWTGRYFNNLTSPTRGYGLAWEVGAGSTLTPQRDPFGRLAGRWLHYLPLGQRDSDTGMRSSRLALRVHGGAILARDGAEIPITQLFLTGGDTTVRGYRYQSIGARNDSGLLTGGRYLVAGSLEWQRPIVVRGNRSDWEHTLFVDAGSVSDKVADMKLFVGVGTGIRWASPVGPLQADLAYGLEEKDIRLHLRLGFNF